MFGLLPQQLQAISLDSDSDSDGAYERLVSLDGDRLAELETTTAALRCVASCNAVLLSVSRAKHHQLCEGFATSLQGFEWAGRVAGYFGVSVYRQPEGKSMPKRRSKRQIRRYADPGKEDGTVYRCIGAGREGGRVCRCISVSPM